MPIHFYPFLGHPSEHIVIQSYFTVINKLFEVHQSLSLFYQVPMA